MNQLIIARHGDCEEIPDGGLTERGITQIVALSHTIQGLIGSNTVGIVSSTKKRAVKSGMILSQHLNTRNLKFSEVFISSDSIPPQCPKAYEIIKSMETETVIVVTHLEYTQHFPVWFFANILKKEFESCPLRRGEAWIIDIADQTCLPVI